MKRLTYIEIVGKIYPIGMTRYSFAGIPIFLAYKSSQAEVFTPARLLRFLTYSLFHSGRCCNN